MDPSQQCLVDSATTHSILQDARFFESIKPYNSDVHTISGKSKLIEGYGTAKIMFPNGTRLTIGDALYSPRSRRTLISFKDIRKNKYHLETGTQSDNEYMYVTHQVNGQRSILESFKGLPSGLYITNIRQIESYSNEHLKCHHEHLKCQSKHLSV